MAKFPFNIFAYFYQDDIREIQSSFRAAADALQADIDRAIENAQAYQDHIDQGGEEKGEWEDGHTLWTEDQVLQLRYESALDALMTLRKAFVLILYHKWERTAQIAGGKDKGDHAKLEKYMTDAGYPLHPDLGTVRDLANALKHNSDKFGDVLLKDRPDMLKITAKHATLRTDWYEAISLTDAHMDELFKIVAESGPTKAPWTPPV